MITVTRCPECGAADSTLNEEEELYHCPQCKLTFDPDDWEEPHIEGEDPDHEGTLADQEYDRGEHE